MASKTAFLVQAFVLKRGQIASGTREAAPSQGGAIKRAEAWAPRYAGTAALSVTADDESGEVSAVELLASHSRVPDDLIERIREG